MDAAEMAGMAITVIDASRVARSIPRVQLESAIHL